MAAVDAEFVRNEFEKVSREVEASFGERAKVRRRVLRDQGRRGLRAPRTGVLSRELARLFGEGSSVAVQHQLREVMRETSAKMREDLLRQFSSADGSNPLADFKAAHLRAAREASVRQEASLEAMREQMVALKLELAALRSEREKASAVDAEAARGTAKGRPYEEAVAEAVEAIANGMGDDCDAVGDFRGGGGRKGDVLVDIDGCAGAVPRADRLRGQELAALAQGGAGGPRRRDGPAGRGLRRLGGAVRGRCCQPAPSACARSAATSCSWSTTPRTGRGWLWRSRTRWRGRGC